MSEVDDSQSPIGWEAARGLGFKKWCGWRGSNPRPSASEADTLSTELQPHHPSLYPFDPKFADSNSFTIASK